MIAFLHLKIIDRCFHSENLSKVVTITENFLQNILFKPMPHGSDKWPEKNCKEIRHSLCMTYGNDKLCRIIMQ